MSKNAALTGLFCSSNNLSELDLSNGANLYVDIGTSTVTADAPATHMVVWLDGWDDGTTVDATTTYRPTFSIVHTHDWGVWAVTKEATMSAEGTQSRACKNDPSHIETRSIPKVDQTDDDSSGDEQADDPTNTATDDSSSSPTDGSSDLLLGALRRSHGQMNKDKIVIVCGSLGQIRLSMRTIARVVAEHLQEEATMKFEDLTPQQKEKAIACKTPEELIALAKEEGVELTDAQLGEISGGGWSSPSCGDDTAWTYAC